MIKRDCEECNEAGSVITDYYLTGDFEESSPEPIWEKCSSCQAASGAEGGQAD